MIPRTALASVERSIGLRPVTLITGARQVGKTTLCREIAKKHGFGYVTLADRTERSMASNDPDMFLKMHRVPLIIDEVQYAPGLFDSIEAAVDKKKFDTGSNEGMYLLTGSQAYNLMENVTQSMAGRVSVIRMSPLSLSEMIGRPEIPFTVDFEKNIERCREHVLDPEHLYGIIVRGSYPELCEKEDLRAHEFYSDYVDSYITRDVSQIIGLKDQNGFLEFMELAASLTGQEFVYNSVANAVGVNIKTIQSWIGVLAAGDIIHMLQPYSERSVAKRITRRPKIYFRDTGLACHLAKVRDADTLRAGYLKGPMFETFIVNEIMKSYRNNKEDAGFYYYRDSAMNEIDLIMLRNGTLSLIECKAGVTYGPSDVRAFGKLKTEHTIGPSCIICASESPYPIKDGVYALPVTAI